MSFTWYSGPASNFPGMDTWVPNWVDLFNTNKPGMLGNGDTGPDVGCIFNAISQAAQTVGVDERVILCIIMQESGGNVGVQTTTAPDGSQSAGLMQCDGSPGFPGQHGLSQVSEQNAPPSRSITRPLTGLQDQITSMIMAGTQHFKSNLQQEGDAWDAPTIYEALRLYNSGSIDPNDLSNGEGATASYVSDIANRLQGRTN